MCCSTWPRAPPPCCKASQEHRHLDCLCNQATKQQAHCSRCSSHLPGPSSRGLRGTLVGHQFSKLPRAYVSLVGSYFFFYPTTRFDSRPLRSPKAKHLRHGGTAASASHRPHVRAHCAPKRPHRCAKAARRQYAYGISSWHGPARGWRLASACCTWSGLVPDPSPCLVAAMLTPLGPSSSSSNPKSQQSWNAPCSSCSSCSSSSFCQSLASSSFL